MNVYLELIIKFNYQNINVHGDFSALAWSMILTYKENRLHKLSSRFFLIFVCFLLTGYDRVYCYLSISSKSSKIQLFLWEWQHDTPTNEPWWRHQMETFSALLAIYAGNSLVPGEFPAQRPVTRSFDVFFDLHPNKRLNKQWCGWWFETPSCPFWRHQVKVQPPFEVRLADCRWTPLGVCANLLRGRCSCRSYHFKVLSMEILNTRTDIRVFPRIFDYF